MVFWVGALSGERRDFVYWVGVALCVMAVLGHVVGQFDFQTTLLIAIIGFLLMISGG